VKPRSKDPINTPRFEVRLLFFCVRLFLDPIANHQITAHKNSGGVKFRTTKTTTHQASKHLRDKKSSANNLSRQQEVGPNQSAIMAPSFDHLPDPEDEDYDEDEEIDFSDLRERFEVQLEQGLDAFVVVDGLPEVTAETRPKLIKFLKRKLDAVGKVKEDSIHMPLAADGKSER
jgi:hypothetical protein